MARLLADEHIVPNIVKFLRLLGHEVELARNWSSSKSGDGLSDEFILETALEKRLIVVTKNVCDFLALHKQIPHHAGILCCTFDDFGDPKKIAREIDSVLKANLRMRGLCLRVKA